MKGNVCILIFGSILLSSLSVLSQNDFYPVSIRNGLKQYVAFGPELYEFSLPSLSLTTRQTYNQTISFAPVAVTDDTLYFDDNNGSSFEIDTEDYELEQDGDSLPSESYPSTGFLGYLDSKKCEANGDELYCFYAGNPAYVVKTINGTNGNTTISLNVNLTSSRFIKVDTSAGILHVTGSFQINRGGTNMTYWQFSLSPFQLKNGPISLINTSEAGCPVPARQCAVPILLYMDANNGVLSYVFSIAVPQSQTSSSYQINVVSYNFECGYATATFDDANNKQPTVNNGNCRNSTEVIGETCSNCGTLSCCKDIRLGNVCYNSTTHQCVDDASGSKVLCGGTDQSCGGYCYDIKLYGCDDKSLYFLGESKLA